MEGRGPKSCKVTERGFIISASLLCLPWETPLSPLTLSMVVENIPWQTAFSLNALFPTLLLQSVPWQTDLKRLTAFHSLRKTMNPYRSLRVSIKSVASPEKCRTAKTDEILVLAHFRKTKPWCGDLSRCTPIGHWGKFCPCGACRPAPK